jgi:hypothetical protein
MMMMMMIIIIIIIVIFCEVNGMSEVWTLSSLVGSGIPLSGSDHQLHLLNPKPY